MTTFHRLPRLRGHTRTLFLIITFVAMINSNQRLWVSSSSLDRTAQLHNHITGIDKGFDSEYQHLRRTHATKINEEVDTIEGKKYPPHPLLSSKIQVNLDNHNFDGSVSPKKNKDVNRYHNLRSRGGSSKYMDRQDMNAHILRESTLPHRKGFLLASTVHSPSPRSYVQRHTTRSSDFEVRSNVGYNSFVRTPVDPRDVADSKTRGGDVVSDEEYDINMTPEGQDIDDEDLLTDVSSSEEEFFHSSTDLQSHRFTNDMEAASPKESEVKQGKPVIYRYFGRSRTRSIRADSVPFIVLGPSVDHWKQVGRILASRGFNVIACESIQNKNKSEESRSEGTSDPSGNDGEEGEALVLAILEALKWQRAILVGCNADSILAMEAALRLAPDRVAGLILCGDLTKMEGHVKEQFQSILTENLEKEDEIHENISIDGFLRDFVDCPCRIIWDGDVSNWDNGQGKIAPVRVVDEIDREGRSAIVGGGSAPHRVLPEQFAWVLSRFAEKEVGFASDYAPYKNKAEDRLSTQLESNEYGQKYNGPISQVGMAYNRLRSNIWKDMLPDRLTRRLENIFSPGTVLVSGRAIATVIIYLSIAKVSLFQYKNFRSIQSSYLSLTTWESQVGRAIRGARNLSFASLPRLFKSRSLMRGRNVSKTETIEANDSDGSNTNINETILEEKTELKDGNRIEEKEDAEDENPPRVPFDSGSIQKFWFLDQIIS